jgi:hypothetical protein
VPIFPPASTWSEPGVWWPAAAQSAPVDPESQTMGTKRVGAYGLDVEN